MSDNMEIIIFTDGSSRGNPGPGGWGSVVVAGEKVTELGGREDNTTNNRMELTACIEALSLVSQYKNPVITTNTDSSYVINGITKWVRGWKANGWITKTKEEVLNRDLWEKLSNHAELITSKNSGVISWKHVDGHAGIAGNERCDEIATLFADKTKIDLYNGQLSDYSVKNILDLSVTSEKISKKSHSKARAYSYVSMVNGKIETHQTWTECEARVKGKSATRYKKAISPSQEKEIIAEFSKSVL